MKITRNGFQPPVYGPDEYFTGVVRLDTPFEGNGNLSASTVTFEPGARTAWHTHPLGQTLIITFGMGRIQREGGPVKEVRPGDVVFFEPDEKHWHGAPSTNAMVHIAIAEKQEDKAVTWMEKVTDEQYAG